MAVIIEMVGVSKQYHNGHNTVRVLNDIHLEVFKGEFLCVLGPSGCGKSTLLRQLAGFDERDSGHVLMHGQEMMGPAVNRMMIFQDFNQLFPWKSVLENVIYPQEVNGIGQGNEMRRQIALKYLRMVELDGFENNYPHQLSGGMKQKAAIARALALEPEVLLLDEPFGSLDALTRSSLQEMLLKVWQEKGVTIVFVTHDIQEALILADRIAVMGRRNGQIKDIVHNTLLRPRAHGSERFAQLYGQVYSLLDIYEEKSSSNS